MARVYASPVRVDEQAFGDPRITMVGELAGYNAFEALGRMTHLWRWCTQRRTYTVTESTVRVMLGPHGVEALLGAELGERTPDGIRVCGTKGRIEWAEELASKRKAAGEARAKGPRCENGTFGTSKPPAHAGDVLDDSPAHESKTPAQSSSRSRSRSGSCSGSPPGEEGEALPRPAPDKPARTKNRSTIPAGFTPEPVPMPDWFQEATELAQWRDYHSAKGTLGVDWNASWRTWCRNAQKFRAERGGAGPRAGPPIHAGSTQIALAVLAQLEAEEAERNRS